MIRRRRKYRKPFPCGHRGFGRYCHRCTLKIEEIQPQPVELAQIILTTTTARKRRQSSKQRWQRSFADDPIDLTRLPPPIVLRTRRILAALHQGVHPVQLQGKRFHFDRTLLRIPVTYRYRLLCRWEAGRIIPLMVLSHEAYNAIARNKKRLNQG